ncbi:MAG: hypothetical protein ACI4NA_03345 [Succinivibrio sp.]
MAGARIKGAGRKVRPRNFVQAHVMEFNVPKAFEDQRRRERSGYRKHKRSYAEEAFRGGTRKAFFMPSGRRAA